MVRLRKVGGALVALALLALAAGVVSAQTMTPSVTAEDQALTVTVESVHSDGPGWIVIHADNKGSPGLVLGHTAVSNGENDNVPVEIDPNGLTPTVWAMLHVDAGTVGTYENPGADAPVTIDGAIVQEPFSLEAGMMMTSTETTPMPSSTASMTSSVTVQDQALTVTVKSVVSNGPGWIVIHADNNGAPGAVLGHSAVSDGENSNVSVAIDPNGVTPTLWAMLHTDAGETGVYEFPGVDSPVSLNGSIVMQSFALTTGMESSTSTKATATPEPTATPEMMATATPEPTATAQPTATAAATATPMPSGTATPTPSGGAVLPQTGAASLIPLIAVIAVGILLVGAGLALSFRRVDK